jgi:pyruvate dehydrogenase E2 component (dihydrolipoamide acetyltransferase)
MTKSKLSVPHFYLTVDAEVKELIRKRNQLNLERHMRISYNDILMKAVAQLSSNHPECNVAYVDEKILYYKNVNICLAVAVSGGLLTPVVRNCEEKSIREISEETLILIDKARSKKLRPHESLGGTFTITNLGMYGIEEFAAIINPPQAMILAVGAIRETPVIEEGKIGIGMRMKMTLSCDHRIIDGAMGATFLSKLKALIENPEWVIA